MMAEPSTQQHACNEAAANSICSHLTCCGDMAALRQQVSRRLARRLSTELRGQQPGYVHVIAATYAALVRELDARDGALLAKELVVQPVVRKLSTSCVFRFTRSADKVRHTGADGFVPYSRGGLCRMHAISGRLLPPPTLRLVLACSVSDNTQPPQ